MTNNSSTGSALRSVRRFILGPWPLHIEALWALLSVMILVVSVRLLGPHPILARSESLGFRMAAILAAGVLLPSSALVPLLMYRRIRARFTELPVRSLEYLLSLAIASVVGAAAEIAVLRNWSTFQEIQDHAALPTLAVRIFAPLWFLNAVLGTFFARIQKESDTARAALETVVSQRRLLLESEERVRGQVAAYLHDRVQTDLVSIALRIRATIGKDPELSTGELTSVIADIERLRSQEVRRASRQLSPNLATVSFDAAMRDLAESYRPAMDVSINISDAVARRIAECSDDTRATGLYRICEQGLLNAAIHGLATECTIQVTLTPHDELVLHLSDNGIGVQGETLQPGMGMTVISAWVEALGGQWSLEPSPSGMVLRAIVPCA